MKTLTTIVLCFSVATVGVQAQRGGHGGFGGGGFHGGGGFRGGGGGFRGGGGGFRGFHGGVGFPGNRGVFVNRRFGFGGPFIGGGFWGWPAWGWGGFASFWPGYYPYGYGYYPPYYGYASGSSPNVVVIYPQSQPSAGPVYYQPSPAEYNDYRQEAITASPNSARAASPTYLIALKNHVIFDAKSYSVKGDTIYFVTIADEQKSSPMIMVDRGLTARLNSERGVYFALP